MRRFTRWYGASPLHLLALLACFGLAGYAAAQLVPSRPAGVVVWFAGAVAGHDLVLMPLYSIADRSVLAAVRHRAPDMPTVPWINYLRVPTGLSALLLLVWFPLILRLTSRYRESTALSPDPFLRHWLAVTGALFLLSAAAYALRLRAAARTSPAQGEAKRPHDGDPAVMASETSRSRGAAGADQGAGTPWRPLGWQAPLYIGLITVALGIIVAVLPTQSVTVIAVLLGILMIVSGLYHLLAVFGSGEHERLWYGIAGLLFIIIGVVLIRHLQLSIAVIGLIIGFTWIVQGVSLLLAGSSGDRRTGSGWSAFFGVISLVAGIVVVAAPVASVSVLATLMGIWFVIMGLFETFAALLLRRAIRKARDRLNVPGQRSAEAGRSASRRGVAG